MSRSYRIAVIPGDGTGSEVVSEGIKALKAVSKRCGIDQFKEYPIGGELYLKSGTLLPHEVVGELKGMDAIYLGAIGHPEVQAGILEREILLKMRFELDLYINLRPVSLYPGEDTPLKGKKPEDVDFVVVRENTEGLYAGGGGFFKKGTLDEVALQESVNTRRGVERCIRYAFQYCRNRNKKKLLTLCSKTNVLIYEADRRIPRTSLGATTSSAAMPTGASGSLTARRPPSSHGNRIEDDGWDGVSGDIGSTLTMIGNQIRRNGAFGVACRTNCTIVDQGDTLENNGAGGFLLWQASKLSFGSNPTHWSGDGWGLQCTDKESSVAGLELFDGTVSDTCTDFNN